MKIKFEEWFENKKFPSHINYLFNTSVVCYKAEANSAALLMAYLGFLVILKERILAATKPALLPDYKWNPMIGNLQNEDKWEQAVFDATQQLVKYDQLTHAKTEDAVFVINDNLRLQIKYWKDRRNDCVHYKDNEILNSHVESFYAFLESNLQKITTTGGKASLINKLQRHYDPTFTLANQDVTPLCKEIKGSVDKTELKDFWNDSLNAIEDIFENKHEIDFIHATLRLGDKELSESLIQYLKGNEYFLKVYLQAHPSLISFLQWSQEEVRNFWKVKLPTYSNPLPVYAAVLRNKLIHEAEINEANELFVKAKRYRVNVNDHLILKENGFGDSIYDRLFVKNNNSAREYWKFLNNNVEMCTDYVEAYPLKDEAVKVLCEELSKESYFALFLQKSLNILFERNKIKREEFKQIALKHGNPLPKAISELHK
ncbi:MAG: hypothetical protein WC716_06650 [Chitinophagaceae bacterium]|jgi:hypothetical protein